MQVSTRAILDCDCPILHTTIITQRVAAVVVAVVRVGSQAPSIQMIRIDAPLYPHQRYHSTMVETRPVLPQMISLSQIHAWQSKIQYLHEHNGRNTILQGILHIRVHTQGLQAGRATSNCSLSLFPLSLCQREKD